MTAQRFDPADDRASGIAGRFDRYTGRTTYFLTGRVSRVSNVVECAELGARAANEMFNHWGRMPDPRDLVLLTDDGPLRQRDWADRTAHPVTACTACGRPEDLGTHSPLCDPCWAES